MVATVEDGKLTKLRPDADHPLSSGYACPKGIAMEEVVNDPDRVLKPLRRKRDGSFEEVSWESALTDIADRLSDVLDEHGKESVAWYMGNPGAFSYSHTLWAKGFLDAIGSPHYYTAGSQDVNNRFAASALLYGSPLVVPIPDLRRTDFLLMVGANPLVSHGSVLSAPRVREQLLGLEKRGGRVVVVDPRRSETAKQFEHLPIRPTPTPGCCCRCCRWSSTRAWPTARGWPSTPRARMSSSAWCPATRRRTPSPAPGCRPTASARWPATSPPRRARPPTGAPAPVWAASGRWCRSCSTR